MKRALLAGCTALVVLTATAQAVRAVDQDAIDKAVGRGEAYLRNVMDKGVQQAAQPEGVASLVGLTLLECGAGPDDAAVRKAVQIVRSAGGSMHETYTLALALVFLDCLDDPADEPLIESIAVRLLAGQGATGGWSYTCPDISESEVRRLGAHNPKDPPKDEKDPDAKPARRTVKDLPKEIQDQLARLNTVPAIDPNGMMISDNSNTQFATLALWVARRHGLPVEKALARIDQRFRLMQNIDGGWAYSPPIVPSAVATESTATMTCAGVMALAVAQGAAFDLARQNGRAVPDLTNDRAVRRALAALSTAVGTPVGKDGQVSTATGRSFYFLWSLERVCVILDLDALGGKDWYAWGSEVLVANQATDGSWMGAYTQTADTCFALLFLKRANVARDLTAALKGKLKDSGEVTLKSAGIGGDALKGVGNLNLGVESKDRPTKDPAEARPPAEETEGGRMARELAQAPPERRDEMVQKYRDGKGVTFTEALATAIPQLSGDDRRKARDALAERLTRMKADTLSRYFQDQDAEVRRAAVLAAAMKEAKTLIPDLIPLLSDPESTVAHAAHAALKDLSGETLGPTEAEWKAWWKNRDR